jgi:hypothetical protein
LHSISTDRSRDRLTGDAASGFTRQVHRISFAMIAAVR